MVLVENLRVDLSKNNTHYAQMFWPDMWLSMKASSLLCSTYIPSEYTHNVCQLHGIFIIFNSQFILALHLSEDKMFSAEYVAQPLSSTSNSREGSFCFILSIKLDHYYLLTLIKRCTSSSEISFDLISCRKSIKLKRNKAPGTGEKQNTGLWRWQWNRAWSKSW